MEAPADFPGDGFPSLRSFNGRENELPIDAHGWLALIAPRRCMIDTAHNDQCEPTFAVERSYFAARKIFRLLGREENLRVDYRPGGHSTTDERRERDIDWFDTSFGRGAPAAFGPQALLHHFDWDEWKSGRSGAELDIPDDSADKRARILWSLGKAPAELPVWSGKCRFETEAESKLLMRDRWASPETIRVPVCFGDGVRGNVYFNPGAKSPMPAVIWLHPYSYSTGYCEMVRLPGEDDLPQPRPAGLSRACLRPIGVWAAAAGRPGVSATHPEWSPLGRMIADVSAAVDFRLAARVNPRVQFTRRQKRNLPAGLRAWGDGRPLRRRAG